MIGPLQLPMPVGFGAVGLVSLLFFAVFVYMVVWTYRDASTNSEHPAVLWAAAVFLAPLLGLVLYLILGRNRRRGRGY